MSKKIIKLLLVLSSIILVILSVKEFFLVSPKTGQFPGGLTQNWLLGLVLYSLLCLVYLGFLYGYLFMPGFRTRTLRIIHWRGNHRITFYILAGILIFLPSILLIFSQYGQFINQPFTRIILNLIWATLLAVLISKSKKGLFEPTDFLLVLLSLGSVYLIAIYFSKISAYPFSLYFSEGNRLYDYSVFYINDHYIYPGKLTIPYFAPGRYYLWGLPFLIPGAPIWLLRLWDSILWTIPYFVMGYALTRWNQFCSREKVLMVLWVFLFMHQGPIYPQLILSAILIILIRRQKHWWITLPVVVLAGVYASLSRWTWFIAPSVWYVLIVVNDFNIDFHNRPGKSVAFLIKTGLISLIGIAAGTVASGRFDSLSSEGTSVNFSQPLLWFRLLPNATFTEGIILGLVLSILPLLTILIWLNRSGRWKTDWFQNIINLLSIAGFLIIGLVISVKIGGGSNLHNLDMLLVTLVILTGIVVSKIEISEVFQWPKWSIVLLVLVLVIPVWQAFRKMPAEKLPAQKAAMESLESIEEIVQEKSKQGEVLFMDQRQLLTFDYIKDIPLVSEYEKKLVIDKAMAGDTEYFSEFYNDLSDKRFSLIVSNPLNKRRQLDGQVFAEENNAWVKWVSRAMLCYYRPVLTLEEFNVQLLVPKTTPKNCPNYIQEVEKSFN